MRSCSLAVALFPALAAFARGADVVQPPRVTEIPAAAALAPVSAAAAPPSEVPDAAPAGPAPLTAAAALAAPIETGLRRGVWAIGPEEQARYEAAVDRAKAELDALFVGRGPASAPPAETVWERLAHPLARRPRARWRGSGWVEKTADGWRLLVPGADAVPVVRWSADGNPIVLLRPRGGGVLFRPTQDRLPALAKYHGYLEGGRMTLLTKGDPIRAFYDPTASPPIVGVDDGHHRFHVAVHAGQDVYVELTDVRHPFDWEVTEGRWGHPLF